MADYELNVPIRRPWLALLTILFFFPFWDFIKFSAFIISRVFHAESQVELFFSAVIGIPFALITLSFASLLGYWIGLNLFGTQELRLEKDRLRLRSSFLGFGKWREFKIWEITKMRSGGKEFEKEMLGKAEEMLIQEHVRTGNMFAGLKGLLSFFGIAPGIVFRAKKETVWFGCGMEESHTGEVVARLRMHLPEGAFL